MPRLRWSVATEGPIVLGTVSAALLVYGYLYEDILQINKGALPGVALLVILVFSVVDFLVNRSRGAELEEYAATGEGYMTIGEIATAIAVASLYTASMLYIGVIVTTTVFITAMSWHLGGRPSLFYLGIAILVGAALWLIFTNAGGVYFGRPLLF